MHFHRDLSLEYYGHLYLVPNHHSLLLRESLVCCIWEFTNSHKMEIFCWKPYHSQAVGFWRNWRLLWNPDNPQSMGNVKCHTMGILWEKLIYCHTMVWEYWYTSHTNFYRFLNVWESFSLIHNDGKNKKWMGIPISFPLIDFERFILCCETIFKLFFNIYTHLGYFILTT